LEFGDTGFCFGGRKTGEPGEKPLEQGENQQQTQSTYVTGPGSNPGAPTTAPSGLPTENFTGTKVDDDQARFEVLFSFSEAQK